MGNFNVCREYCFGNQDALQSMIDEFDDYSEEEEEEEEDFDIDDPSSIISTKSKRGDFKIDITYYSLKNISAKTNRKKSHLFRCVYNGELAILELYKKKYLFSKKVFDVLKKNVKMMKVLQHENLLKFHGITLSYDRKSIGILHSWSDGGSVDSFICNEQREPMKTPLKLNIVLQLSNVMMYLHHNDIIHGSLSWDFIFFENNMKRILLYDIGLDLKLQNEKNLSSESPQNLRNDIYLKYMSPEVITKKKYSIYSDIYSFGILLYELFTDTSDYNPLNFDRNHLSQPRARPPIDSNSRICDEECLGWIINLMKECWQMKETKRPSFQRIHSIIVENMEDTIKKIGPFDELSKQKYYDKKT